MTFQGPTLHEFVLSLLTDPQAQAAYEEDPEGALRAAGLSEISPEDVQDVVPLVMDHVPAGPSTGAGLNLAAAGVLAAESHALGIGGTVTSPFGAASVDVTHEFSSAGDPADELDSDTRTIEEAESELAGEAQHVEQALHQQVDPLVEEAHAREAELADHLPDPAAGADLPVSGEFSVSGGIVAGDTELSGDGHGSTDGFGDATAPSPSSGPVTGSELSGSGLEHPDSPGTDVAGPDEVDPAF